MDSIKRWKKIGWLMESDEPIEKIDKLTKVLIAVGVIGICFYLLVRYEQWNKINQNHVQGQAAQIESLQTMPLLQK